MLKAHKNVVDIPTIVALCCQRPVDGNQTPQSDLKTTTTTTTNNSCYFFPAWVHNVVMVKPRSVTMGQ